MAIFKNRARVKGTKTQYKDKRGRRIEKVNMKVSGPDVKAMDAVVMAGGGKSGNITKNQLEAMKIQNQYKTKMAKNANIAAAIGQGTQLLNKTIDSVDNRVMKSDQRNVAQVSDLVSGGAEPSAGTRDEDEQGKDWIA